jgi:hypothetical protein
MWALCVINMKYKTVGIFSNETKEDMTLCLEMSCEEVILSPGHKVELLIENLEECFPVNVLYHSDALQVYPSGGFPKWLIKFNGKELIPDWPTKLKDHE